MNCIEHGKLQVTVPWSAKHSRFSMRFESLALGIMRNMDIMNSSMILGITWNMAHGIMKRAVERGLARKSSVPERMGIDEKSYGKNHHYMTIIYDLDRSGVDHVEFDRKESSLDLYYRSIGDKASCIVNAGQDLCKIAGVKLIHLIYFFTHSFHLFFLSVKNSFSCPSACMTRPLC